MRERLRLLSGQFFQSIFALRSDDLCCNSSSATARPWKTHFLHSRRGFLHLWSGRSRDALERLWCGTQVGWVGHSAEALGPAGLSAGTQSQRPGKSRQAALSKYLLSICYVPGAVRALQSILLCCS